MSDATYQPGVYRAQGGNQLVIAPGGTMLIEGVVQGPSTVGQSFFVSSGSGSSSNAGTSFGAPKATTTQALALCTASRGDKIYLLPGHAESVGASGLAWNVAGVSIIGLGNGADRPTFTWHTTDAVVTISGASTTVRNIRTTVDVDEIVSMFLVTGAQVTLDGVDFFETASAQAIQWLLTTNAADDLTIRNCHHRQKTAAAAAQKWIQLVGPDTSRIVDNVFLITANASTSSHLISGTTAVVDAYIARNKGTWLGATITGIISCVTGSTGAMIENSFGSGTSVGITTAYVGDGMYLADNKWADTMGTASGLLTPAVDTDT